MKPLFKELIILAFTATALAPNAIAQPEKSSAGWANLHSLAPGSEVRVFLGSGRTIHGFLQNASPDAISVNASTTQESLPRTEIKRVQVKRPGHRGRNTLIGLLIGTGGGLAVGAAADSASHDSWFPNIGKAVFGPAGAISGTVVGVAFPTGGWRDVYRAP